MTTSELRQASAFLRERFPHGGRVLCAVSGGLDSMCLLDFMLGQAGFSVAAAHFNHRLRGEEADRDQRFVEDWCRERSIPCFTGCGDVRAAAREGGLSLEEAARTLRYAFLEETAAREGYDAILTAHHAGDNAETILLNLVRGTGAAGLAGIPRERGRLIRPFLGVAKEELAAYAAVHNVPHVEDGTNTDPDAAARNLLRLRVMPLLKELNPKAEEHMSRAALQAREVDSYLDRQAKRAFVGLGTGPGWVSFPWETLRQAPPPLQPRLLLLLIDQMGVGRKDFGAAHFNALLRLENERSIDLPHGLVARRERGRLFLCWRQALPSRTPLEAGRPVTWGRFTLTLMDCRNGAGLALREGPEPLSVGPCDPAARLVLPGTRGGGRTVKRLCLDHRISLEERASLPAVYAGGRLAAVWRIGVDESFLPAGESCRFVRIEEEGEHHGQ